MTKQFYEEKAKPHSELRSTTGGKERIGRVNHYEEVARKQPRYSPTRMAELAPGVIAVEDQSGECDALFDVERWQFTNPQLWERGSGVTPSPLLKEAGLEVLEGVGRAPQVSTIEAMVGFARSHLSSKGKEAWHSAPQFFTA